jgi:hypothetical protein
MQQDNANSIRSVSAMNRRSYHRAYYWRNLERRRAAARLSRWRQRARAMGIDV